MVLWIYSGSLLRFYIELKLVKRSKDFQVHGSLQFKKKNNNNKILICFTVEMRKILIIRMWQTATKSAYKFRLG